MAIIHRGPGPEKYTSKYRGWCFTINNFSQEEKNKISELIASNLIQYGIAETEHEGEGEGTPHIQGYIYFKAPQTFTRIKLIIGERAHIEPAKGNPTQNYEYCSKENTVFAMKDLPTKGVVVSFLEQLKDIDDLSYEEFERKYPKFFFYNFERIFKIKALHQKWYQKPFVGDLKQKNFWLWGQPGVGKTRWATSQVEPQELYDKVDEKWWDNYDPDVHRLVLFDEVQPLAADNPLSRLLIMWADAKVFSASVKGSLTVIQPRKYFFVVTSNFPPEQIFQKEITVRAAYRRFNVVEVKQGDLFAQNITKIDRSVLQLD